MLPVSLPSYPSPEPYRHINSDTKFFLQQLTTPDTGFIDEFNYLCEVSEEQQRQEALFFTRPQLPQIQEQRQQQQQQPSYILNTPHTPTSLPPSPNGLYPHISPAIPSYININNSTNASAESSCSPVGDSNRGFEELARHWSARTEADLFYAHKTEDVDVDMSAWHPRVHHSSHSLPSPLVTSFDETRAPFTRKRRIENYTDDAEECKHHRPYVSPPDSPEMKMDQLKISSPTTTDCHPGLQNVGGGSSDRRRPGSGGNISRGSSSPTSKNLTCSECNKKYSRLYNLTTHVSRVHRQVRKFCCEFVAPDGVQCDGKFSAKGDLKRHTRTHNDDRPYECKHSGCEKRFPRTEQRDRHHFKCEKSCSDIECRHKQ